MATVEELLKQKRADNKNIIVDADYQLRDKKAEAKDPEKRVMNTREVTSSKWSAELEKIKAEARAEARADVRAELLSGDFLKDLKEQVKKEMAAEKNPTTKTTKA